MKTTKNRATLLYIAGAFFFLTAIVALANDEHSLGACYLALGSTFLCLGSAGGRRAKEDRNDEDQK